MDNFSVNTDIGIREIRQLTGFIREKHGVDFADYALTSFKRCVEHLMNTDRLSMDMLLEKLESGAYLDHFIGRITVGATELFRDPTFWILLKNNYLANIFKENARVRIWLPMCASGEEFYSLAILLKESGWTQRTDIYVSGMSDERLEEIRNGQMDNSKLEISAKNYLRFQGVAQFTGYYETSANAVFFDQQLFAGTEFFRQSLAFDNNLPHMHLILFRNQLIYFNSALQFRVCDLLYEKLAARGLLALGILEEIDMSTASSNFNVLNKNESIYQKRS
jgi:chemotaxis protein methyltransferase CheR